MADGCPFEPTNVKQWLRGWAVRLGLLMFVLFWPAMWYMRVAGVMGWLELETTNGAAARLVYSIVRYPLTLPPYSLTPFAGAMKYLFIGFIVGLLIDYALMKWKMKRQTELDQSEQTKTGP